MDIGHTHAVKRKEMSCFINMAWLERKAQHFYYSGDQ